jgi:hypothetical protein
MITNVLDRLRYRSEGTDLDFKQAQYRFVRGTEADKSELLKDVLAIANAWRDDAGYILIGFRDARPHPAEVTGIAEQLDDAALQQFINSKVKPKLSFRYEEHIYEGKTVALITIPKQKRPFYLQHSYGGLKSNVVYVRRGSSTDEAEPPEIVKMASADEGKVEAVIELLAHETNGTALAQTYERAFINITRLPDYEIHSEYYPDVIGSFSPWKANRNFLRETGKFFAIRLSTLEVKLSLKNRSSFRLTGAKLEVAVEHLDGHRVNLILGEKLPDFPEDQYNHLSLTGRGLTNFLANREPRMTVDRGINDLIGNVRLGDLLPGETARAPDTLGLRFSGAGRIVLRCRILAG